jgi:DNA primase
MDLRKAGRDYSGCCPFHNEKTPSFHVNEEKQVYHCFGCGAGGDVFRFVQDIEKIDFLSSLKRVAEIEAIKVDGIEDIGPREINPYSSDQNKLIKLHELACAYYEHMLFNTAEGAPALEYLHNRGLNDATIKKFRLGYAPSFNQGFVQASSKLIEELQISNETLQQSSLFNMYDSGVSDRFTERVMFPIANKQGKVIAFSGRTLKPKDIEPRKYINSSEGLIFNKSSVLYNFNNAAAPARKTKEIFLCEGQMDVIALDRADATTAVASMGTSLTPEQIALISSVAEKVIITYDADAAGVKATLRAIEMLAETNLETYVVRISGAKDPDEYLEAHGEQGLNELLMHGRMSAYNFKKSYYTSTKNINNEAEKTELVKYLIGELPKIKTDLERELEINKLAQEFNLSQEFIRNGLAPVVAQSQPAGQPSQQPQQQRRLKKEVPKPVITKNSKAYNSQLKLMYRMITSPEVRVKINAAKNFEFRDDIFEELYVLLNGIVNVNPNLSIIDFARNLPETNKYDQVMNEIAELDMSREIGFGEIEDYQKVIKDAEVEDQLARVKSELEAAKQSNEKDKITQLTIELIELNRKLK